MGTRSPVDSKKNVLKTEDIPRRGSPLVSSRELGNTTPPRLNPPAASRQLPERDPPKDSITTSNAETTQPLAPPPRPAQHNVPDTPDYFSSLHNPSHLSLEPNPFEQSFGNTTAETPGKSMLPSVAALTSPASLLHGGGSSAGFPWPNSLRSGPLSPAMLTGPTGTGDYFDGQLRASFPTPNESSLRTGLTPGGGGSMFPAPSPNSQALFQQLASGGATPSTLDFHRTALNMASARKSVGSRANVIASQPQDPPASTVDVDTRPQRHSPEASGPPEASNNNDPFGSHDANDAANGLFLLAQARNGSQSHNEYAAERPTGPTAAGASSAVAAPVKGHGAGEQMQGPSPTISKRPTRPSVRASLSGSLTGMSEISGEFSEDGAEQIKPSAKPKGRKGAAAKGAQSGPGRRKAEDTPSKAPANKKSKASSGNIVAAPLSDSGDGDDAMMDAEMLNENGKKMTDEEKRKNFLERNRVAALKCRQRKKQWLANLQAKVEIFSSENDALSAQVTQLREEIVNLKTVLLAHKDCPVSQAQGLGMSMNGLPGEYAAHHPNPYSMAIANAGSVMSQRGMQRR
ncbi:MAG: hypothetical protein M1816_006353 [Peltula sp. TS41687]|nr:MAG: hypothetical protein M1816_006353 [Peltula sp. TS41687]